ncbi:hypothetical protein JD77_00961 [Micromonospora olivasterospora]|uniref:Permease n=1 Tax=Micromonospora olivasterospora TaxID=1880 RepID=A0A562I5H8_MICOL|nr:hypothetical protein JD77_00961 [Micromonospora olivasterospora]
MGVAGSVGGAGSVGVAGLDVPAGEPAGRGQRRAPRVGSVEVLAGVLILLVVVREPLARALSAPRLQTWTTVFVSVLVQAVPFLVFGVLLSAVIAVFVPRSFWARALPRHPALAVPVASAAGVVLPGCECGSVPIAGSLIRRGVTPAAALAFLLAAQRSTRSCSWPPRSPSPAGPRWSSRGPPPAWSSPS